MSITKKYLQTKPICKVKFRVTKAMGKNSRTIHLVGDFNNWDKLANPMKKLKNNTYVIEIALNAGKEHQFKYLIDGESWANDPESDKYIANGFQGENSVIVV